MKRSGILAAVMITVGAVAALRAQDGPQVSQPQKEHQWLQQLVGEWEMNNEATFEPGKPPIKCTGTETVKAIGGFWVLSEIKGTVMGQPMTGIMTVGYDPEKKKFVGTWVDNGSNHLWTYEGTLDADGKTLTLEAEGPNPMAPGKTGKFRDTLEVKDKDHKVLRSAMLGEDGKWVTFMTGDHRRKK